VGRIMNHAVVIYFDFVKFDFNLGNT
jgi:hypothetical protein